MEAADADAHATWLGAVFTSASPTSAPESLERRAAGERAGDPSVARTGTVVPQRAHMPCTAPQHPPRRCFAPRLSSPPSLTWRRRPPSVRPSSDFRSRRYAQGCVLPGARGCVCAAECDRATRGVDRGRGPGAPVGRQPARARDPRAGGDRARRCPRGGPLAEPAGHVRSRVGGRRHRAHHDGRAAAADHRPARLGSEGGVGAGRCQFEPRRRRAAAPARRPAAGVRGPGRRADTRARADRRARPPARAGRRCSPNARPPATRRASIACAPSAKCSTSRPTCASPPTERARAQADARELLRRRRPTRRASSRSAGPTRPTASLPPLDALVEQAESTRGELHRAAARSRRGGVCRRGRPIAAGFRSPRSSRAPSRRRRLAVTSAASSRSHAAIPLFDRARPERALAAARAAQAEAQAEAFRVVLRGQIAALRAAVRRAPRRPPTAIAPRRVSSAAQIERIAQVSYDAGERGILELLDAYRIGVDGPRPAGDARRRRARRRRSSWNSSADGRFRDDDTTHRSSSSLLVAALTGCVPAGAEPAAPSAETADARRHALDGQDRALHGVSAARGRPDGAFAVHLTTLGDFKPLTAGQAARRVHAGSRRARRRRCSGPQPSRPGAFRVEGAPPAAGTLPLGAGRRCAWTRRIATTSARSRCSPTSRRRSPTPRSSRRTMPRRSRT